MTPWGRPLWQPSPQQRAGLDHLADSSLSVLRPVSAAPRCWQQHFKPHCQTVLIADKDYIKGVCGHYKRPAVQNTETFFINLPAAARTVSVIGWGLPPVTFEVDGKQPSPRSDGLDDEISLLNEFLPNNWGKLILCEWLYLQWMLTCQRWATQHMRVLLSDKVAEPSWLVTILKITPKSNGMLAT